MPSIRRSLIAYFLVLLAVALGAVGLLTYRFAEVFSEARGADGAARIDQEYRDLQQEAEAKFDRELAQRAANLGREWRWNDFAIGLQERREREPEENRRRRGVALAYAATGGAVWYPGLGVPVDGVPNWYRNPLYFAYQRHQRDELLRRAFATEGDGQHPTYYFQFQYPQFPRSPRQVIRGPHLTADLPPVPDDFAQAPMSVPWFENVKFDGVWYRRVMLKTPHGMPFRGWFPDPSRMPGIHALAGGVAAAVTPNLLTDRGADPLPYIFVQCARPKSELDEQLADLDQKREREKALLSNETREALGRLQSGLAAIGAATFIALALGGWWLVGRGLSPVRELSEAVSRVSEKDFRLPVEPGHLSHELVPIHDRLTQTLDALRRAFEREKQAVADISHELRTPIAALLTTLDVSLRKTRSAEQYRATLEECRDIGKQLRQLVERIMTLAWLDAGNDRSAVERVDAAELAAGCATLIRPLAEAQGLTFAADIDPGAELVTDPDKLREVLMNLLGNAVEYNSAGGRVELRASRTKGGVEFEVRDTGIGMTPEVREKIFERFYRADPSRHATGVHAGLGLSIVKEYVERLGGTIAVDSAPGAGSVFRVTVPSANGHHPTGAGGNGSVVRAGYAS